MQVTQTLRAKVDVILTPDFSSSGSVTGMLERINFHASANTFHLYSMIGPKRVTCKFPEDLTAKAEAAVNKYVRVSGKLLYKAAANFPHAVEVSDIDVFPQEKRLPDLSSLRGVAPDATGDKDAVAFVWSVRDEW